MLTGDRMNANAPNTKITRVQEVCNYIGPGFSEAFALWVDAMVGNGIP